MSEQQSSAARVAGKSVRDFWYTGFRYWLTQPLTMGKYADEEMLVLWKRNDPGEFAGKMIQRLPLTYHQGVLNAAALANNGGIPTEDEWHNYGASMWKKAYRLWVCLDPRHKEDPNTKKPLALIDGVNMEAGQRPVPELAAERDRRLLALLKAIGEALDRTRGGRQVSAADFEERRALLTGREREVMDLVVAGHPNKAVAGILGISVRTAEVHRAKMMEKMGCSNLSGLIHLALARI